MRKSPAADLKYPMLRAAQGCTPLSEIDTNPQPIPFDVYHAEMSDAFALDIQNALSSCNATTSDATAVQLAVGLRDKSRPASCVMSHLGVRRLAGELLFEQLLPIWLDPPDRSWFFGTFISDVGNSLELAPHIELGRIARDVRKMLALTGMHAIGVVELQLARYPLEQHGRTLQAHVHTIGYVDQPGTANPAQTERQLAKTIAARSTLTNWLGVPVAAFREIPNRARLSAFCAYLLKAPLEESWLERDSKLPRGYRTRSHGNVGGTGALRLAEILASLTLRSATFAHGDLVRPKGDWIRQVSAWCAERPMRVEPDYASAFTRIWAGSGLRLPRAAPVIRRDARAPVDPCWREAMADRLAAADEAQSRYDVRRRRIG